MPTENDQVPFRGQVDQKIPAYKSRGMSSAAAKKQFGRKVGVQIFPQGNNSRKRLEMGESQDTSLAVFQSGGNFGIVVALNFIVAVVNDFSDLVTWQNALLVGQALDLTALMLLLFASMFASRTYFLSIFIILFAFFFEILPVIGILPWWTIGIALWYLVNNKKNTN